MEEKSEDSKTCIIAKRKYLKRKGTADFVIPPFQLTSPTFVICDLMDQKPRGTGFLCPSTTSQTDHDDMCFNLNLPWRTVHTYGVGFWESVMRLSIILTFSNSVSARLAEFNGQVPYLTLMQILHHIPAVMQRHRVKLLAIFAHSLPQTCTASLCKVNLVHWECSAVY